MPQVDTSTFEFLKKIRKNNNREWYHANKDLFTTSNDNMKSLLSNIEEELNKIDSIEKKKLFRIYRDVRFSKDKTPYNSHFSMSLAREGAYRRGGYFIKLTPGGSMVGGGFYNPEPKDIKLIRSQISADDKPLRKILKAKKFKDTFGELMGDQVKSAPRDYDKDHPSIDLLKYKSMYVFKSFTVAEVLKPNFTKEIVSVY